MRKLVFISIGISIVIVCVLIFNSTDDFLYVDLNSDKLLQTQDQQEYIQIAIAPILSPNKTIESFEAIANYISEHLNRPVRLLQRKTYSEINELLRQRRAHAAFVCTGTYLSAKECGVDIDVIAVSIYTEKPVYQSLIIVSAKSGIKSIQDLQGKSFAYTDLNSLSGYYYPIFLLLDSKLNPDSFFSQITFTYSHTNSINAVISGSSDGAAVHNHALDLAIRSNKSLEDKINIIHRSPALGFNPVVVPHTIDTKLKDSLTKILIEMKNSVEGIETMKKAGIKQFDLPTSNLYDEATRIYKTTSNYFLTKEKK
ncbi:MAG: phosphate/phosphite/phosphonate ABC transporter substrate-binding protein [Planctomycetes bacterium]|nr:phosphate/phosphite/phosphonate ABC transporter substrate-binding protein [Planctomycetota bacterium]